MVTAVISKTGTVLNPTCNIKKVRCLLKDGKAAIVCHDPFAIQLSYNPEHPQTQPMELTEDTGYQTMGISIKTAKHEYLSEERTLLTDEKQRHQKQKMYRRNRRGRGRYRKPMNKRQSGSFRKQKKWLAPSIQHKADAHVERIERYCKYFPITSITLEMGQFDTAVLSAVSRDEPVPEGVGYQHGPKYGFDTLREAVFSRDKYTCKVCGKSAIKDGKILVLHHIGYRKKDRSNRIGNLLTVCTDCHTAKNHAPGGKLWSLNPRGSALPQAAFMNAVKWHIYDRVKELSIETHITYGAVTKRERLDRNIAKTHANDAYCIGMFRPKHRTPTRYFKKRRRNNRCLEKFYDAVYLDIRTGEKKKASALGCNRTKRSVPRNNPNNERCFRCSKVRKGYRSIRQQRHPYQAGETVRYHRQTYTVKAGRTKHTKARGFYETVELAETGKQILADEVTCVRRLAGWQPVPQS